MRKVWLLVLLALAATYVWRRCTPIQHAPVVLQEEPRQVDFTAAQAAIQMDGWTLKPLATFSMKARVLGITRYDDGPPSKLAPYDLALGWGPMSDTGVLERLNIRQSNRFYHWTYWGKPPVPEKDIISHSTNAHIIPAGEGVLLKLKSLREGSLIQLAGVLVEATHPQAEKPWRSSLSRTDAGEGSCEIIYVKSLVEE
ncbi:hypothetical protein [Roseimicrobium gellanilyticum]|nr:hypothetical protein [Roseimicrobium gellanilyticum]